MPRTLPQRAGRPGLEIKLTPLASIGWGLLLQQAALKSPQLSAIGVYRVLS